MTDRIEIVLETGRKRTFASAIDWPGWSRSGRDADAALAALVGYGQRYAHVLGGTVPFAAPGGVEDLAVVERLPGSSGTDFGVPSGTTDAHDRLLDAPELERQSRILEACWRYFDAASERAVGRTLTTGPRGGGRSLDKIAGHVAESEAAYLQQLGSKPPRDAGPETIRELILETLRARATGDVPPNVNQVKRPWSPRYFVRRAAWHVLDHAWEIEDRSGTAPD